MQHTYRAAMMAALLSSALVLPPYAYADPAHVRLDVVGQDGEPLISIPLRSSDHWCLLWNHSVAGFMVSDCFVNRHTRMLLHSSHQPDFAAGLGHLEGRGELVSDGQGGYRITRIDEPVAGNALTLRVGSMAVDHRLLYDGKETSLSKLAAGQRVTLRLSEP